MSEDRQDTLRKRAYQLWEEAGRPDGEHERHWRDAEHELAEKSSVEDNNKAAEQIIEGDDAGKSRRTSIPSTPIASPD